MRGARGEAAGDHTGGGGGGGGAELGAAPAPPGDPGVSVCAGAPGLHTADNIIHYE